MPNNSAPTGAASTNPTVMIYARTVAPRRQVPSARQPDVRRLESLAANLSSQVPTVVTEHAAWEIGGSVLEFANTFDILLIPGLDRLSRSGSRRVVGMLQALHEHHTRVLSLADEQQIRAGHALDELDLAAHPVTPDMYVLDEMRRLHDDADQARFHRRLARGRAAAGARRTRGCH